MKRIWMALIGGLLAVSAPAAELRDGKLFGIVEGDSSLWITEAASGRKLFRFGNLSFQWAPQNASVKKLAGMRAELEFANDATGECRGFYDLRVDGNSVMLDYMLHIPEEVTTDGMIMERFVPGGRLHELCKSGIWTRHAHGGVPYEVKGAVLRPFPAGEFTVWEKVDGNPGWGFDFQQHIVFRRDEKNPAVRRARVEFKVLPKDFDGPMAAAVFNSQALALDITREKPFGLFEVGEVPEFRLVASNPAGHPVDAELQVIVTGYDGRVVIREAERRAIGAAEKAELSFELPKAARPDIWFIEATGTVDGREVLLRSTVAAMERHEFKPDTASVFGMAGYFPVPDREQALELLRRIGVRHLRHDDGNAVRQFGMDAGYHTAYDPEEWNGKPEAEQQERIREHVARLKASAAVHWEFGNENEFKTLKEAQNYVGILRQIRQVLDAEAPGVELWSIGFANGFGGVKSLELVAQAGGWPLLDGIAYHLGRGNTVPDLENAGDGWFYLSSLQELEKLIARHGAKPVHLTEIYTPTFPNTFWDDSLRNAAENVPLSYAIALARGVKSAYYYQLNDSVWFDVGGVNPADREYSFGMLCRNGDVKPTLLAYQTAAKMLEGAKFEKEFRSGETTRGYVFLRPDNTRVALLWDRAEGYTLNRETPEFAGREPWIPFWTTHKSVELKSSVPEVLAVNPIGQEHRFPVKNGRATVAVSGEPQWIIGAEF